MMPLNDVSKHTGYIELPEMIVMAANKDPKTKIVVPCVRHGSEDFYELVEQMYDPMPEHFHDWEQGFITSRGRFVDRQEAWTIAANAKQIRRVTGSPGTLFSEDLY